ncbi:hypothetical protein RB601_005959 [Gaeumannomyces tritici]
MPIIEPKGTDPYSLRNITSHHLSRVTLRGCLEVLFLCIFPGLALIFSLLCLTGCVTDVARTPDFFVVSLAENINTTDEITIQVGYFGMCLRVPSAGPICKSTAFLPKNQLSAAFLPSPVGNLTNTTAAPILQAARTLQEDKILAPFLLAPVVLLAATCALSSWYQKAPHNKIPRYGLAISAWAAAAAASLSSAATTQAGAALAYAAAGIHGLAVAAPSSLDDDGAVSSAPPAAFASRLVTRGAPLEGLQWAAAGFQVLTAGYAMAMIYSARFGRKDGPKQVSAPVINRYYEQTPAMSRHQQTYAVDRNERAPVISHPEPAPAISRPRQSYNTDASSRYSQFSETHNVI